jgi:hypothetical protein
MTEGLTPVTLGAHKVAAGLERVRVALVDMEEALEEYDLGDGRQPIATALRDAKDALAAADRGQKLVWDALDAAPQLEVELENRIATLEERLAGHERDITMLFGRTRNLDSDR